MHIDQFTCLGLLLIWAIVYFVPHPISKYLKKHRSEKPAVSLQKKYVLKTIPPLFITGLCLLTAYNYRVPVFGTFHIGFNLFIMAIGVLAMDLCLQPLEWKLTPVEIKEKSLVFFPRTPKERFSWIPISLIVAITEEIIYRAVFFSLLLEWSGNSWIAGIISAFLFALTHLKQGLPAACTTFLIALAFQYLVVISGGLYIAIAIHFIHNLIIGIVIGVALNRKSEKEIAESLLHILKKDFWRDKSDTNQDPSSSTIRPVKQYDER